MKSFPKDIPISRAGKVELGSSRGKVNFPQRILSQ